MATDDDADPRQLQLALTRFLRKSRESRPESPTLETFAPRWIQQYCKANKQKPRGVESKLSILRHHLLPRLGHMRLDEIAQGDILQLKAELAERHPKTVNNVLTTLSKLLKVAVEMEVIEEMPVTIRFLKVPPPDWMFYEFEEYDRLLASAARLDPRSYVTVLLGGDAGLRLGEIVGLEWEDVDFRRELVHVRRSDSRGFVTTPKGGRGRIVPMSDKLHNALCTLHSERTHSGRILIGDSGRPATNRTIRNWLEKAQAAAGLPATGAAHILRHTFCSHRAIQGAPMVVIKELAGHASQAITERYVHLSNTETRRAIAVLDKSRGVQPATGVSDPSLQSEWRRRESNSAHPYPSPKRVKPLTGKKKRFSSKAANTRRTTDALEAWRSLLDDDENKNK